MPSLRTLLAGTASAERLKAVWSSGSFSTIGDQGGSYHGFKHQWGHIFQIEGDCWNTGRQFHCLSTFDSKPQNCDVRDQDGNTMGEAAAQRDTTWIGISIGMEATCVVESYSDDASHCPVDDGNGPLHVVKDNHGDTL
ncbi:hypothetical protein BDW60DRAFT_225242 [Aspergillus nidulans var. acristatus]|jgi:hypothetical protein